MAWIDPVVLENDVVRLVPLEIAHCDALKEAVADGRLWELWFTTIPTPEAMQAEIERRLALRAEGSMMPFTAIDGRTGRFVGQTTYMNIDAPNRHVEIGSTWYSASAQRTALNTNAKLLLLAHAFERLEAIAVEFRTSSHNERSRRAIERLGAKLDGILRSYALHSNGTLRDTACYSITAEEWPQAKARLQRLALETEAR